MTAWSEQELASIEGAYEIRVAGRRNDGSLRSLTPVWHVVVDGAPYVRSMYGTQGQWYKGVAHHFEGAIEYGGPVREVAFVRDSSHDDAIDEALYAKYGRTRYTDGVTNELSKQATLRIEPR